MLRVDEKVVYILGVCVCVVVFCGERENFKNLEGTRFCEKLLSTSTRHWRHFFLTRPFQNSVQLLRTTKTVNLFVVQIYSSSVCALDQFFLCKSRSTWEIYQCWEVRHFETDYCVKMSQARTTDLCVKFNCQIYWWVLLRLILDVEKTTYMCSTCIYVDLFWSKYLSHFRFLDWSVDSMFVHKLVKCCHWNV
jgi:hypothetical protein